MRTLLLAVFAVALVIGGLTTIGRSQDDELTSDVRISARLQEDGRIEFALQPRHDGEWSDRILPSRRQFPAVVEHSNWLRSSAVTPHGVITRIVARRLDDGRTEFGLQRSLTDDIARPDWSEVILPSPRFFPVEVEVGRWLNSGTIDLTDAVVSANPVPAGVPIQAPDGVALERADLDGWSYNGLEWSFYYGTTLDPLTDHVRTWIVKVAPANDDLYDTMRLQIACEDDGEVSTIIWDEVLPYASGTAVGVRWRIDGGAVIRESWRSYNDNDWIDASSRFASAIKSADEVVVEVSFYSKTLTATFANVSDMFRTRVQPNLDYCGRY